MKKLILLIFLALFSACSGENKNTSQDTPIRVAAMRGPTAMGLLQLMDSQKNGETKNDYEFELFGSPELVTPRLLRGEADIAVVPGNMAAVLYDRLEGDIQALAIVTLGVLHIVDATDTIHSVADLKGRTIHLHGKGITPEIALNYVLEQNGLIPGEDVALEFCAEHAEAVALLDMGRAEIALLPEPFVSTVLVRNTGLRAALDLSEEWSRVSDYDLIMSVVIARREFIENNPEALAVFLEEYEESVNFINSGTSEGARLAAEFDLVSDTQTAEAAIKRSNIVFITGEEMRRNLTGFYRVLFDADPQLVGGEMPEEDFFYIN